MTANTAGIDWRSTTKEHNTKMSDTWFTVEDNPRNIFSGEDVKVSFYKDPKVGRVWVMSHSQLADLYSAIEAYKEASNGRGTGRPAATSPDTQIYSGFTSV